MSEPEWRWKFGDDPDGWFGTVAVRGGEIVGNYTGWGMRFRMGGEERLVYAVGDVATAPSVRGLGRSVFRDLAGAFYESVGARGVPLCFGFPNERHRAISHRLVGSQTLFPIRELSIPIDGGVLGPPPADAYAGDSAGPELESLWEAARMSIACGAVRDRLRVNWRFHARPTRYYRMVWLGSPAIRAWLVLSIVGERALVADFLAAGDWNAELPPLFAAAGLEARRLGARRLVFWETPGGPGADLIAALPGERSEAGYPIIVRPLDPASVAPFASGLHLVPSLYDLV